MAVLLTTYFPKATPQLDPQTQTPDHQYEASEGPGPSYVSIKVGHMILGD